MYFEKKDGFALAYEDTKTNLPPIVFVHGCGLDHTYFTHQLEFFKRSHRVILVDLLGHGQSDAPQQNYTMPAFAGDLAWLCRKLELVKPVMVGHSMGGNVLLELAARYQEIPSSVVMIDSCIFPPQAFLDALPPVAEILRGPHFLTIYQQHLVSMCLPTEEKSLQLISEIKVPQHVLVTAIPNHVTEYDATFAATGCRLPIGYIGASNPLVDLSRFKALTPQVVIGHTLGAGHFPVLEVPDQVNAMIAKFIQLN